MVEVSLWVGLGTLGIGIVIIWRVFVIEAALHDRVDEIDRSLGSVVGMIIEKNDHISSSVPDINLINQNPIGQIIDFLKGNSPEVVNNGQPKPRDSTGQFVEIEVEPNATPKEEAKEAS